MKKLLGAVAVLALAACSPSNGSGGGGGGVATGGGTASGGGGAGTGGGGGSGGGGTFGDGGTVTWYRDVLPITQVKCQGCHQAGGIAPFSMETYATASPMALAMAADAVSGRMPPWMPAASCGMSYVDDRRLSQAQIDTFNAWAAQGAPEGNPADAPPPIDGGVGQLGWVDQTVMPVNPYTPSASLTDDYHCSVIDPQLSAAKDVVGYQVLPQVRAEVHHVILYAVDRTAAQAKDVNGQGWTCFGGSGLSNEIFVGGWAPGSGAVEFPDGTGIEIPSSDVFVMQVHYNTANGVRQPDQTSMQLQYAKTAVKKAVVAPIVDSSFSVPPMAMNFTPSYEPVTQANSYGLPIKVWGLFPHMHTHGKHITVTGPSGCLIDIPAWDFHWQQQYFFTQPITVNNGESVGLTCTWDNPTSSPLTWGEGTADEMCLSFMYMTL